MQFGQRVAAAMPALFVFEVVVAEQPLYIKKEKLIQEQDYYVFK